MLLTASSLLIFRQPTVSQQVSLLPPLSLPTKTLPPLPNKKTPNLTPSPRPGSIEQAISTHPSIAECCIVPLPSPLKGHLPFAFLTLSTPPPPSSSSTTVLPSPALYTDLQTLIRTQIGAIAALGGAIVGHGGHGGMIPKTRSGKTLRRVLRQLLENGARGEFERGVEVPATVEDEGAVEVARGAVRRWFEEVGEKEREREKAKL